ncbi:ribonuclease H-like domain-containing protein [Psychrobacillus sp. FJAT-51614]|uniref:Ribonuclease H-like domain-containing protein n=1 Tax=Psychrobacillus mangrovi TaxID=3117745 RepID=A0ABU8F0N7_9BACI
MSYEKKLLQLKGLVKKNSTEQIKKEIPSFKLPFYTEKWIQHGLKLIQNEHGFLFVKESFYSNEHIHGNIVLSKLTDSIKFMQDNYPDHPLTVSLDNKYSFYDTETTGLKGTGVLIFLNGVLTKTKDGFLLKQYVLADPSQETAFLYSLDFWRDTQTIITYNGKSFDLPQLISRWTMNRNLLPKLKQHDHIDLMHTSKRIWKGNLERFKLKQIEEQKLGFQRNGDIPGHLAPIIYFDAVKTGNPVNLMKVLKHNEWDILSLVTLYIITVDLLIKKEEVAESSVTYTNIGKWFQDLKTTEVSFDWFKFVVDHFPKQEASIAYMYVGLHLKRKKLFMESIQAFEESLKEISGKYRLKVYIELAKLYEHQQKDYESALEMTSKSALYMDSLSDSISTQSKLRLEQELYKRRERIIRKINISRESAQHNKKRVQMP